MGFDLAEEALQTLDPASLVRSLTGNLPADSMAAVGQIESMVYLRNQLLRDSDWASMAHSVEMRTPLVDACLLRDLMPVLRSFGRFKGKFLLAASPSLPLSKDLINRSKTGFGIPLGVWGRESRASQEGEHMQTPAQGGGDSRSWAKTIVKNIYSI